MHHCLQVMPYSTGLRTPLSNFEAGENRKDASDPAITVRPSESERYLDLQVSGCCSCHAQLWHVPAAPDSECEGLIRIMHHAACAGHVVSIMSSSVLLSIAP